MSWFNLGPSKIIEREERKYKKQYGKIKIIKEVLDENYDELYDYDD